MEKVNVVLYCQIGRCLDMAEFSIYSALKNAGIPMNELRLIFICWKTAPEVYSWLQANNFEYVEMEYDEGRGFLWNLYKGWNMGYYEGFKYSDYVCPIATDHAFYPNWLANMLKHAGPNRIVNCKLIEPGTLPTLHTAKNFGVTTFEDFRLDLFMEYCSMIYQDRLVMDDAAYGHRFDAMPFVVPVDVWERFGPMSQVLTPGNITGDTDFFNRCKAGSVEIVKALDAISYHCGGLETRRNEAQGVYT